ncbi:hypothetical protein, partial [Dubosiella newyorkensis]|uniref:hypothetical protein n=1 Tax=Dubosiella newyorkensis TaxID=1862672 RepID=UPI00272D6667
HQTLNLAFPWFESKYPSHLKNADTKRFRIFFYSENNKKPIEAIGFFVSRNFILRARLHLS